MNHRQNYEIYSLHAYLLCLSRLQRKSCSFGANSYDVVPDVDTFGKDIAKVFSTNDEYFMADLHVYHGYEIVSYNDLQAEILKYINSHDSYIETEARSRFGRSAIWDINEFYGLASTNMNKDGVFHPLVRGPVYRLNITSDRFTNGLFFLVKIEDMHVLTYFLWLTGE